jgi:hypothetical protein
MSAYMKLETMYRVHHMAAGYLAIELPSATFILGSLLTLKIGSRMLSSSLISEQHVFTVPLDL